MPCIPSQPGGPLSVPLRPASLPATRGHPGMQKPYSNPEHVHLHRCLPKSGGGFPAASEPCFVFSPVPRGGRGSLPRPLLTSRKWSDFHWVDVCENVCVERHPLFMPWPAYPSVCQICEAVESSPLSIVQKCVPPLFPPKGQRNVSF